MVLPGSVQFQGIGTRLRRSRSKDHSSEFDNLSSTVDALEIANLRQTRNIYEHGLPSYMNNNNNNNRGGTLERPKRLYNFSNVSESSTVFMQQPSTPYGSSRSSCTKDGMVTINNYYDDAQLLGHQYEEPHHIMDHLSKGRCTWQQFKIFIYSLI